MKIEDILKNLLKNDTYTIEKEETEILLNYIADLQRKEYELNKAEDYIGTLISVIEDDKENFKIMGNYKKSVDDAIEYIKNNFDFQEIRTLGTDYEGTYEKSLKVVDLLNILTGGDEE